MTYECLRERMRCHSKVLISHPDKYDFTCVYHTCVCDSLIQSLFFLSVFSLSFFSFSCNVYTCVCDSVSSLSLSLSESLSLSFEVPPLCAFDNFKQYILLLKPVKLLLFHD